MYRDKRASGYSTKSFITKMGGANGVLDIIVTDNELWIRSLMIFASIGQKYDLLHRIQKNKIQNIVLNGSKITIDFININDKKKQIILKIRDTNEFLISLKK